jgi:hypothetical protein
MTSTFWRGRRRTCAGVGPQFLSAKFNGEERYLRRPEKIWKLESSFQEHFRQEGTYEQLLARHEQHDGGG